MDENGITNQCIVVEPGALRKAAVENARAEKGIGAEEHEDCGEEILQTRREAAPGCTRCVHCQTRHERRQSGRPPETSHAHCACQAVTVAAKLP